MKTQQKVSGSGFRPTREQVGKFIIKQVIGVVSTLDSDGWPRSATVAFSVTKDGELLVGTSQMSHKAKNIGSDERVAVTVTDAEKRMTVQLQGNARIVSKEDFDVNYANVHYEQRPQSLPFKDDPNQCHILIQPTTIKFTDASIFPWVVTEMDI